MPKQQTRRKNRHEPHQALINFANEPKITEGNWRAVGVGAQVGSEYLDLWHAADGRTFYRVTDRAIRELHLGQLASAAAYATLSESSFAEDWQSEEDSAYDRL